MRLIPLLAVLLLFVPPVVFAQDYSVREMRSWAPERLNLETFSNNELPSSDWKRPESNALRFVVAVATVEVTTTDKESVGVEIEYSRFNITAQSETFTPIGSTTPDGRARFFTDVGNPGKYQLRVSGDSSGAPAKHEFFVGVVFAVPREVPLTLHHGKNSFELKPKPVATLQETIPVTITVASSEFVPELVGAVKNSRSAPKLAPVVAPSVGKILVVRFLVQATARNHEHVFPHFVCHSSDFTLVNGDQIVPLHKVLSEGHILKERFYQTPLEGAKAAKQRAPFTGELVFLADPAVKTWDLYYGTAKVDTFSPR